MIPAAARPAARATLPALCAVAAAIAAGAPGDAEALSCAPPRVAVTPAGDVAAPLNTRVLITIPPRTGHFDKPSGVAQVSASLRERGKSEMVPVARIELGAGEQRQIELAPVKPLRPRTQYDVLLGRTDKPDQAPTVAGSFRTGGEADRQAPIWNGVERATISPRTRGSWGWSGPYARLRYVTASDESTPTPMLRFGVWLPDASGKLDYTRPPVTWEDGSDGIATLTGGGPCGWATFGFPIVTRLGVRVADLAGNLGPPSEVRLIPVRPDE
jgi:hypothetical protein